MINPIPVAHMSSARAPRDTRIFLKKRRNLASRGHRVHLAIPGNHDGTQMGVNMLGVPKLQGRLARVTITAFRMAKLAFLSGAMVVHFHDPEQLPWGILIKTAGRKVVYDVHEDLPLQILSKTWIHPALRRSLPWVTETLEWISVRCLDCIVAATPNIAERFPMRKTFRVQNFPLTAEMVPPAGSLDSDTLHKEMQQIPGWSCVNFRGWQSRQQVAGDCV